MRIVLALLAAMLLSVGAVAQQPPDSGGDQLPVSLDRIRKALAKPAPRFTFNFDVPSTFRSEVHEQDKLDNLISSFDFRGGPTPAGGLYNYEAQRVMHPPSDSPLMQPYAAFNGGQLLTLSLEALAQSTSADGRCRRYPRRNARGPKHQRATRSCARSRITARRIPKSRRPSRFARNPDFLYPFIRING